MFGNLIGKDAELYRNYFKELCRLRGISGCKYKYLIEEDEYHTIYGEIRGTYSEDIDLPLIFVEHPDQLTMDAVGWVSEDNVDGDKPYIVQVPIDTKNIKKGCLILIPFGLSDNNYDTKVFEITSMTVIAQYPYCYTCRLAPKLEANIFRTNKDYTTSNFNYLDIS